MDALLFNLERYIELSPDFICIAGYDGYFKKINPAVSKTLGYSNEELFARPIDDFIHPADKETTKLKRASIIKNNPLLSYENRYLTKNGDVIWLIWTSIPISSEKVVFAIAKDITSKKRLEELKRIASMFTDPAVDFEHIHGTDEGDSLSASASVADQLWIAELEALVRKYAGKTEICISRLSFDLATSERQLYRRVKSITGVTPNKFIRIIRLQIAKEAIESGKYRTVSELAHISGFETTTYFSKLFKEIYNCDVSELL